MLEQTAAPGPARDRRAGRRARAAVPGRDASTASSPAHFYGHLDEAERLRFLAEARARRGRARGGRLRSGRGRTSTRSAGTRPQRRLALGGLQALVHRRGSRRRARRRRRCCTTAAGSSSSARRRDALPVARLAEARPGRAAARASRPATRSRRCRCSRRSHGQRAYLFGQAPGIVEGEERRPWRGRAGRTLRRWLELDEDDVLRDVLLRVGHTLLSGSRRLGPRRPHADARGTGALRSAGATTSCGCSARG